MPRDITIVGAGLTGLLCSLYLAKRGYAVNVIESRSNLEIHSRDVIEGKSSGRSMSMDLSARGLHALDEVGACSEVISKSVPMVDKLFHNEVGRITRVPYGPKSGQQILTVSRNWLYQALLSQTKKYPQIQIAFQKHVESIELATRVLTLQDRSTTGTQKYKADILIGADGANSKVRHSMEVQCGFHFRKRGMRQSYKELSIPEEYSSALSFNAMHLWARNLFMLVAQPNSDRSFTCALLLPEKEHVPSFADLRTDQDVQDLFETYFRDVYRFMPNLIDEFHARPLGRLGILQGDRWSFENQVLILGDAAHSMVPFFGQGVNCCFEDCSILNECLSRCDDNWERAIPMFEHRRIQDANAISQLSYENYPELLHSNVAHRVLLKKQIESAIAARYADQYLSYHNLVCFQRVPYRLAMACKQIQEPILERLASSIDSIDELDWQNVQIELSDYHRQHEALLETHHESERSPRTVFGS